MFETTYEKGEITAVAYRNGKEFSRYTLQTTGCASGINVTPEKTKFAADNRDLCYFDISIVDGENRLIAESEHELEAWVMGGELLGIFSGNPISDDDFTTNRCHAFKGRALAIVRAKDAGKVAIKVLGKGLAAGYAEAEAE